MTDKKQKYSEILSAFLKFIEEVKTEYQYCYEEVNRQEKLTQDYLHALELGGLLRDQIGRAHV